MELAVTKLAIICFFVMAYLTFQHRAWTQFVDMRGRGGSVSLIRSFILLLVCASNENMRKPLMPIEKTPATSAASGLLLGG